MLQALRKRTERDEDGFTLIELMVVVLIIGILLAIAVPTFLKAQENAKTKAATSNLRSALSAAKTVFAEKQSYSATDVTQAVLKEAEPSLDWVATAGAASDQPETISWTQNTTGTIFAMANRSKLGDCFYIIDNVSSTGGGTTYAKKDAPNTNCTATTTAPSGAGVNSGPSTAAAKW